MSHVLNVLNLVRPVDAISAFFGCLLTLFQYSMSKQLQQRLVYSFSEKLMYCVAQVCENVSLFWVYILLKVAKSQHIWFEFVVNFQSCNVQMLDVAPPLGLLLTHKTCRGSSAQDWTCVQSLEKLMRKKVQSILLLLFCI